MIRGQKFCHGAAVALGEKRILTAGISPFLDGNGFIELFPKSSVVNLLLARQGKLQTVHGNDPRVALGVEQQILVAAVIDEKGLIGIAAAEVVAKKRENLVFRFDFRPQNAVVVRKTNKSAQLFHLAIHMTDCFGDRIIGWICLILQESRPILE